MKMPNRIDCSLFAPCGMNCLVCYRHCDHPKPCAGCLGGDSGKPGHCRQCQIKACAEEKAVSHCFKCPEYPCKRIKALEKSYTGRYGVSLVQNSMWVQAHGLAAFLERQREQFICPRCGGIVCLHTGECSECQKKEAR